MDMEKSPEAPPPAHRRRTNNVVERKLGDLDACLAEALSFRPRRSDVGGRLFAEIQAKTDFLRMLIAAERECHGDARPEHLVDAEARFAVLVSAFEQWVQRGVAEPTEEEAPEEEEEARSWSACSCTDSCFGFELTGQEEEITSDAERRADPEAVETRKAAPAPASPVVPMTSTTRSIRRRWWRRSAGWCGAAGVVAALAVVVGVAIDFPSVAHHNVYLVPT